MKKKPMIRQLIILMMVATLIVLPFFSGYLISSEGAFVQAEESDKTSDGETSDGETSEDESTDDVEPEFKTFEEMSGKTFSMLTGAPFEELIASKVGNVEEYTYYSSMADMILGLKSGKTDAILMNNAVGQLAVNRDHEICFFPEDLSDGTFGIAFAKGDERVSDWQKAFETIPEETKQELWEKWTGSDDSKKVIMEQDWPGKAGSVKAAAVDTLEPMSYYGEGGQLCGFDVEMILLMAKELDIHVDFTGMDLAAALSCIESGKADIACGSIIATDERKEKMDFVEYYPAAFVLIVRSVKKESSAASLWDNIKLSFEKTFIRESRYKMFISGLITTLVITFLSIIFGILLGFIVYMVCRNGNKVANGITKVFTWLIQGLPVVVLLMVLYYIIFADSDISGVVVSIIAFSLVFGSTTFGMLKTGVGAVDKGQAEAAYALGYSDMRCFFRIILPQAFPHFIPIFKGEVVALAKATAIVGYIAVQDLTKMGDIIRGRTYEAFFPLIAVAIIYLIIGAILRFLVGRLEILVNPKRRKKPNVLKGINVND